MPGYSETPLASKLGIKPRYSLLVVGAPMGYPGLLHPLPEGVVFTRKASERTDLVHFFSASRSDLSKALEQPRKAQAIFHGLGFMAEEIVEGRHGHH